MKRDSADWKNMLTRSSGGLTEIEGCQEDAIAREDHCSARHVDTQTERTCDVLAKAPSFVGGTYLLLQLPSGMLFEKASPHTAGTSYSDLNDVSLSPGIGG